MTGEGNLTTPWKNNYILTVYECATAPTRANMYKADSDSLLKAHLVLKYPWCNWLSNVPVYDHVAKKLSTKNGVNNKCGAVIFHLQMK